MRGACPPLLSAAAGKSALMAGTLNPALGAGFLLATLAFALATIERTEWWPDRSRLVATFRMPAFLKQRPVGSGAAPCWLQLIAGCVHAFQARATVTASYVMLSAGSSGRPDT